MARVKRYTEMMREREDGFLEFDEQLLKATRNRKTPIRRELDLTDHVLCLQAWVHQLMNQQVTHQMTSSAKEQIHATQLQAEWRIVSDLQKENADMAEAAELRVAEIGRLEEHVKSLRDLRDDLSTQAIENRDIANSIGALCALLTGLSQETIAASARRLAVRDDFDEVDHG